MPTIDELVRVEVPWLAPGDDISSAISSAMIHVGMKLEKGSDENEYSDPERLLVAYFTSYKLILSKSMENMEGSQGSSGLSNRTIKKGVAGPLEGEFEVIKAQDYAKLIMKAKEILPKMQELFCGLAFQLNVHFPEICGRDINTTSTPFIVEQIC